MLDPRSDTAQNARRHIQGVFQDPYSSLNPTMTVGQSLTEVLKVHKIVERREREQTVTELMRTVGLSPAQAARRPQAFSGGERQRIGIARALAARPEVIIADEPLSALDVSIQAQVLNLLIELQVQQRLTYLFVTHDLDVAKHISQRTAVMYLGRVVEYAPTTEIFAEPLHPYTQALVKAAPRVTTQRKTIKPALTGDIPNAIERPSGCHFHPRCPFAMPVCSEVEPMLLTASGGQVGRLPSARSPAEVRHGRLKAEFGGSTSPIDRASTGCEPPCRRSLDSHGARHEPGGGVRLLVRGAHRRTTEYRRAVPPIRCTQPSTSWPPRRPPAPRQ